MTSAYLGEIRMFGGNYAPYGWNLCDGSILEADKYPDLAKLLGNKYGGNGTTTFGVPNLSGRLPLGTGQATSGTSYTTGQTGGQDQITLGIANIPAHTHLVSAKTFGPGDTVGTAADGYFSQTGGGANTVNVYKTPGTADGKTTMDPQTVGTTGNTNPIPNQQPYLCVNFIIALFPGM